MDHDKMVPDFTSEFYAEPGKEPSGHISDFMDVCLEKAAIPPKQANRLQIAADEVFANIRAYSGATRIRCVFSWRNSVATLIFTDDGTPYDPLSTKEPDTSAPAQSRAVGGLGIFLVRRLMDAVTYQYQNGLNTLTLELKIPEA